MATGVVAFLGAAVRYLDPRAWFQGSAQLAPRSGHGRHAWVCPQAHLFERLRALLGAGPRALGASIVVSATVFAIAHYTDQGHLGVIQSAITGLVFATLFASHGHIWTPIVAHITFNLTSVVLIYNGWEQIAARAVFR